MPTNPLGALVRRLGAARWFATVFRGAAAADAALLRSTGARFGLAAVAGIDALLLTTTGRRTGLARTVALLYAPAASADAGTGYLVAGSNWGGRSHPGWSVNLLADPVATVTVAGRHERVSARLLTGAERDRGWARLVARWPAYAGYAERAGREIRVFVLEPEDRAGR